MSTKSTPKNALEAYREQKRERSAWEASTEGAKAKEDVARLASEIGPPAARGETIDWLMHRRRIVAELEREAIAKVRKVRGRTDGE